MTVRTRPCGNCNRYRPGKRLDVTQDCAICWGYHNDPRLRAYWDGTAPQKSSTSKRALDLGCALRGEPTRTLEGCGCGAAPGVYACGHPDNKQGECIAMLGSGKKRKAVEQSGLWVCETCEHKPEALVHIEPPRYPAITVRNLIYHVCPLAENDAWRANLRQLSRRWDVFNGRRVLAIVQGAGMRDAAEVREFLDSLGCEGREELILPNDRELREVATFLPLLLSVANTNAHEATWYGHTKGNSTRGNREACEYWRNAMYHHLLDRAEDCLERLTGCAAVGTHKMEWSGKGPYPSGLQRGNWTFAGTFFWFRHDRVFSRADWRNVPMDRYGAEAWLAGMFASRECEAIWSPWTDPAQRHNPYLVSAYPDPIRDEDDPTWLAEQVRGFMPRHELQAIARLLRGATGPQRYVELGSYAGRSLLCAGLTLPKGSEITAVDNGYGIPSGLEPGIRESLAGVLERLRQAGRGADLLGVDSLAAAATIPDASCDAVFIDGDHSRPQVTRDIQAWLPKLKPGGLLFGHDYEDKTPGVKLPVDELLPGATVATGTTIWSYRKP